MIESLDPDAASATHGDTARSFFSPLADKMLSSNDGTLAMVCPTAACSALAGKSERQFFASRFYIEWLVTSHDPSVIAFSDSTSIHETLNVGRRWPDDRPKPPTKVVA